MRRWRGSIVALAALALACGSGGGGGGGPTGPVTVTGSYEGTHAFTFGGIAIGTCTGRVVIDEQTGDRFSGTLTIDNANLCMDFGDSAPVTGTIDGSRIRIDLDASLLEELLAGIACVPLGNPALFVGTLENGRLEVTLTRDFNCPDQGVTGTATWTVEATRS